MSMELTKYKIDLIYLLTTITTDHKMLMKKYVKFSVQHFTILFQCIQDQF